MRDIMRVSIRLNFQTKFMSPVKAGGVNAALLPSSFFPSQ